MRGKEGKAVASARLCIAMGFKIEDIVHPDAQIIAKQFECGVCLCILDEPVQTVCDHIFCRRPGSRSARCSLRRVA